MLSGHERVMEADLSLTRFAPTGQLYVSPGQRPGELKHELTEPQRGGSQAMFAIELGSPRWGCAGQRETRSQAVGLG